MQVLCRSTIVLQQHARNDEAGEKVEQRQLETTSLANLLKRGLDSPSGCGRPLPGNCSPPRKFCRIEKASFVASSGTLKMVLTALRMSSGTCATAAFGSLTRVTALAMTVGRVLGSAIVRTP